MDGWNEAPPSSSHTHAAIVVKDFKMLVDFSTMHEISPTISILNGGRSGEEAARGRHDENEMWKSLQKAESRFSLSSDTIMPLPLLIGNVKILPGHKFPSPIDRCAFSS